MDIPSDKLSRTDRASDTASDGLNEYRHSQVESRDYPRLPADTSSSPYSNADQFLPQIAIEGYDRKAGTPADLSPQAKSSNLTIPTDIYESAVTRPRDDTAPTMTTRTK
jgi:hypothetical protein